MFISTRRIHPRWTAEVDWTRWTFDSRDRRSSMALPRFAFFRGHIVPYSEARVGVLTHALNYGTGCFGGIRGYWNADEQELFVFRPSDHFRRFLESTRLLDMQLPFSVTDLTEAVVSLIR